MTPLDLIQAPAADTAAGFVDKFREIWTAPTPERINALMHPDVRYTQPALPDVIGRKASIRYWRRMFVLVPDLHLDVVGAASVGGTVFVEFVIRGTLGRRQLCLPAVDRYQLDARGLVLSRALYCDLLPLIGLLLRPRAAVQIIGNVARAGCSTAAMSVRRLGTRAPRP